MTDWDNYTRLCSLKDSLSTVCAVVQTGNYRAFHRFMLDTPYDFLDAQPLRQFSQMYEEMHFNPRFTNHDMLTDLNDTPPPVQTSGMAMRGWRGPALHGNSVTGTYMIVNNNDLVQRVGEFPHPNRQPFDSTGFFDSSSLAGKFIGKVTRRVRNRKGKGKKIK